MPHEVVMPALGMTQDSGVIVTWRKEVGDAVAIGDPLFDVETDKTTMEVEAAHAGFLTEIRADAGADVPIGQTIALISKTPGTASGDAGLDLAPDTSKEPVAPTAPNPSEPPAPREKPAAPSTLSAAPTVPILASPKAKLEAHRRGIDLRRLVDQGVLQPFHVADLDRLEPETGTAGPLPQASVLTATFSWSAFDDFIAWAEERTGRQYMRQQTLAAFAAGAFRAEVRSGDAESLTVSLLSARSKTPEMVLRDPDLQGLSGVADSAVETGSANSDLTLIDLSETRLVEHRPPGRQDHLVVILAAMRFLDGFAARVAEPATQLL